MKDIALRCGVSVATVSKALSGQKDIGEDTKNRIRQVAEEMGYSYNAAARALKTNRSYNLGVLFVDEQSSGLAHEYFSSILESFKSEAEKKGYTITFINRFVGTKKTTYLQHCRYRGLDGVLIACGNFEDPEVLELVNSSIPVVSIDYIFNNTTAILADNIRGMRHLVDYVCDKGHKKLALIHGERTLVTNCRVTSFFRTCKEHDIDVPDEWVLESRFHDPERCEQVTAELLQQADRPTCIFFSDDFSAIGGMKAIADAGLRIPEDISVVGYDGIKLATIITPKLTTYKQNSRDIGKESAEHLIMEIENSRMTLPEQVTVKGCLLEGTSVKALS